jgi:hypothetical protein
VKAARAPLFSLEVPRSLLFLLAVAIAAAGVAPLAEFGIALWKGRLERAWSTLTAAWLALGNMLFLLLIAAKGGRETYNWYFALSVFSGAYLLPWCVERYGTAWTGLSRRALIRASAAGCLLLFVVSAHSKITTLSPKSIADYDRALALAAYPEGSLTLAATDCGILGYFSRQRIMNMDGLTNSWEFQAALADGRLAHWLGERGLNAYVGPPDPDSGAVVVHTRAGVASAPRTLRVRVEPMGRGRVSPTPRVYRVTTIDSAPVIAPEVARWQ